MTRFKMRTKPEKPEQIEDMYIFLTRIPDASTYPPFKKYRIYTLEYTAKNSASVPVETDMYNYEFEKMEVPIGVVAEKYINEWAIKLNVKKENIYITKHESHYGGENSIDYYGLMYVGLEPDTIFGQRLEKYKADLDEHNKWEKENADKIKDYRASKQSEKKQNKIKRLAALEAELEKLRKETGQAK